MKKKTRRGGLFGNKSTKRKKNIAMRKSKWPKSGGRGVTMRVFLPKVREVGVRHKPRINTGGRWD